MPRAFRIDGLTLVDDVAPAAWVVGGVRNFQHDVGSLVPERFNAYGRIFHPAVRRLEGRDQVREVNR